jgi:anhydro-N-acetylmuramic acid kinase
VLNWGGIANLTLLPGAPAGSPATSTVTGFDCGPANALLDHWAQQHLGQAFDANGAWAAGGRVLPDLLAQLLAEPFLAAPPPKSTGRDLFNPEWLHEQFVAQRAASSAASVPVPAPQDVQATLAEFTARASALALQRHAPDCREVLVCGGGAFNADLMRRLATALPGWQVRSTAVCGLPPLQVEAAAFAWLAWALVHRQPGNLPEVTGARGLRVLGALYPA